MRVVKAGVPAKMKNEFGNETGVGALQTKRLGLSAGRKKIHDGWSVQLTQGRRAIFAREHPQE